MIKSRAVFAASAVFLSTALAANPRAGGIDSFESKFDSNVEL
jgi:hypothetical protein